MRKSTSIPVHLTVSKQESAELPRSLRPDPYVDDRFHDNDCAITRQRMDAAEEEDAENVRVCPRSTYLPQHHQQRIPRSVSASPAPESGSSSSHKSLQTLPLRKKMTWTSTTSLRSAQMTSGNEEGSGRRSASVSLSPKHRNKRVEIRER